MNKFYINLALLSVCIFTGVTAQNDCASNPCQNGAPCVESYDGYICQCPADSSSFYDGTNCENRQSGDGVCPGGHVWMTDEVRSEYNIADRYECFLLIAIPNVPYIDIQFSFFQIEMQKDEIAIGPGATIDSNRILPTTYVFDNNYNPLNATADFNDGTVRIMGSRAWVNVLTDKNIASGGFQFRVLSDALDCLGDPCLNGGTCNDLVNAYQCMCPPSYTGVNCDIKLDFCSSNPCQNGGTCTADNTGYSCACVPGWTSVNCDIDINECASGPCQNGATCVDGIDEWRCICDAQWAGDTCTISLNPCGSTPCQNGATCVNAGNDFVCECPPGFTGDLCEIDINECSSLPCQNGGTCINGPGMYTCQCREGFTGTNCDEVGYCDLEGEWYNECNDRITISLTSTGMILGDYSSSIALLTGYSAPNVVVGYANQNCDFPSFGFVVTKDNGKSTSSWSGQCHLCAGQEVLYTTWTSTQRVNTCVDIKTATHIGQDRWTRYKQSQAPREEWTNNI